MPLFAPAPEGIQSNFYSQPPEGQPPPQPNTPKGIYLPYATGYSPYNWQRVAEEGSPASVIAALRNTQQQTSSALPQNQQKLQQVVQPVTAMNTNLEQRNKQEFAPRPGFPVVGPKRQGMGNPQQHQMRMASLLKGQQNFNPFQPPQAPQPKVSGGGQSQENEPWTSPSYSRYQQTTQPQQIYSQSNTTSGPVFRMGNTSNLYSSPQTSTSQAAMMLSARGETGQAGLTPTALSSIAPDANHSKSYGPFGLNSWKGSAAQFAAAHPELGLTAQPGTQEFDNQWRKAVQEKPQAMLAAHQDWYSKTILPQVTKSLTDAGIDPSIANDPRVQIYMADRQIQMGSVGEGNAFAAAKNTHNPVDFINAVSQADRQNLNSNFSTYLGQNPNNAQGLINRIQLRTSTALGYSPPQQNPQAAQPQAISPDQITSNYDTSAGPLNTNQ